MFQPKAETFFTTLMRRLVFDISCITGSRQSAHVGKGVASVCNKCAHFGASKVINFFASNGKLVPLSACTEFWSAVLPSAEGSLFGSLLA